MSEDIAPNWPVWEAQQDNAELCDVLRNGLRDVKDPELGMDVIQLGLIRDVIIEDDYAQIKMILTTPFCPYAGTMVDMVRDRAENVLQRTTSIDLSLEPWDFSMMEDGGADNWGLY